METKGSCGNGTEEKESEPNDPQGVQDAGGGEAVAQLRAAILRYNEGETTKAEREVFLCSEMYRLTVNALSVPNPHEFDSIGAAEAIRDITQIIVQTLRADIHLAHILLSIFFKADLRFWAFLPQRLPLASTALAKSVNSAPYTSKRTLLLPQMPLLPRPLQLQRQSQQSQQQSQQFQQASSSSSASAAASASAAPTPTPEGPPQIYIDLVNYFGILGGFDVILDHMSPRTISEESQQAPSQFISSSSSENNSNSDSDSSGDRDGMVYVPVHILNQDLRSLQYVRNTLSTSFGVPYAKNVCDAAFATLLHYYRVYDTLDAKERGHFREAFYLYKDLLHYASRGTTPVRFEDFRLFFWDACATLKLPAADDAQNEAQLEATEMALQTVAHIISASSTRTLFIHSGYHADGSSSSCTALFEEELQKTRYDDSEEGDEYDEGSCGYEDDDEDGEDEEEDDDGTGSTSSSASSTSSAKSPAAGKSGTTEAYNVSYGDIIPGSLVLAWLCEVDIVATVIGLSCRSLTRLSTPILIYMLQSINAKDVRVVEKIWAQAVVQYPLFTQLFVISLLLFIIVVIVVVVCSLAQIRLINFL